MPVLTKPNPRVSRGSGSEEGISREAAFAQGIQEIFGISDPIFVSALRLALSTRHLRHFEAVSERRLLTRDSEGLNYAEFEAEQVALQILRSFQGKEKGTAGKRCLRDCILTLREKCLAFRLHQCVQDSLDRGFDRAREAEYRKLVSEYDDFLAERAVCFSEWRPGIEGNIFQLRRGEIMRNLAALAEKLSSGTFVRLRFCLPDAFGVEHCKVELFCTGSWEHTGEGVFKAHDTQTACFSTVLPVSLNAAPEKVRLTCHGMGGTGIAYVEVVWKDTVFVPQAVAGQEGLVSNPEYLLDNDAKFAWFGGQSTREDYFSRNHADTAEHSLELSLTPRNYEKLDLPGCC